MPDNQLFNWFSVQWFSPATLLSYRWQNLFFLYLVPLVPALHLVRWFIAARLNRQIDVATAPRIQAQRFISFLRFIPGTLFSFGTICVILALARPQKIAEQVSYFSKGIDIMLILDVSGSMEIMDLEPNRLEAAKRNAVEFIQGRPHDRIGLIVFAGEAYSVVPLTTDHTLLRESIQEIKPGIVSADGTAIGNALAIAINRLRESPTNSKVAILISDGENTAGSLNPVTSAELAYAYGIKLYTIGIGKDGRVVYKYDEQGKPQFVDTRLDEDNLRSIAKIGKGNYYRAADQQTLTNVFKEIDKLEKNKIEETHFEDTRDYYSVYLTWGIVLLLMWLITKNTFLTNALED